MKQLNIPKQIHVGCQKRGGTYTGKLAYVIYTDEKGKKRKEVSWDGWRDHKIKPIDYDNEPTSGFVLNKGVGGQRESWGYNSRNEYIRVYDPRGFEFEISVANLLFILQESTSIKGKGLEGEFIYSWDGTELVLLPVDCLEYTQSKAFTDGLGSKVTKKEMFEGHTYMTKKQETVVYLGRHNCKEDPKWAYRFDEELIKTKKRKKQHIFLNTETNKYQLEGGFTKLSKIIDANVHDDYATQYSTFIDGIFMSDIKQVHIIKTSKTNVFKKGNAGTYNNKFFIKCKDGNYIRPLAEHRMYNHSSTNFKKFKESELDISILEHNNYSYSSYMHKAFLEKNYDNCGLFTLEFELTSGLRIGGCGYVKK